MKNKYYLLILLLSLPQFIIAQKGKISGHLIDHVSSDPVPGILVILFGSTYGQRSDQNGFFELENIKPKTTELMISGSTAANKDYYEISIRNIPLDRQHLDIDLGSIPMIERSNSTAQLPIIEIFGFKFQYTLVDGQDRMIDGDYILVDFNNYIEEERIFHRETIDTVPNIFNTRYPGGRHELKTFLASTLSYPAAAVENATVGLSIASCTLNPDGSIHDVSIINPVSTSIDKEIERALYLTGGSWLPILKDTLETFYTQILFTLSGIPFHTATLKMPNMLDEINLTAIGIKYATRKVNDGPRQLISGPEEVTYEDSRRSDEYIAEKIAEAIQKEKYKVARRYLNEAIKRNPFEPSLYQIRIMVNSRLGDQEETMKDVNKLNNFMNGKSLQNIIDGL